MAGDNQLQATVSWAGDSNFIGRSGTGHAVVFDSNKDSGVAPTPMEMLLMSAGACSSVDVVSILQKAKQQVTNCRVVLTGERVDTIPRVFSKIHLHFEVTGFDVSEKHVERAVNLSAEKYCSVSIMLQQAMEVTHSFSVHPSEVQPQS
ncbi:OsmC family protein [Rheinheimera sp.]|uniref:OsmC family protein n=1 Tax=Rheinheimera sp. TaxID=1869214 RepID=UPI0027B9BA83|nr:OsmC family protein [Rheinheimera sp.]